MTSVQRNEFGSNEDSVEEEPEQLDYEKQRWNRSMHRYDSLMHPANTTNFHTKTNDEPALWDVRDSHLGLWQIIRNLSKRLQQCD
ncbi:hypothetical protein HBI56_128840 [Parastagonospora nodorum]|nr:hypothetical protein HBH54_162640 [Parastagonospora nodorum]KAH3972119.1 hypothetical protein HBH51_104980 [Parastagonospora nodorum]KAH3996630.1 hypothetical protein HBI10_150650 [Parastagonospora nodorum]KAH4009155.1 hypothetical protein HBI13_224720 [Parastagonospora nodorum]KAH4029379.1 hypothetical protein HBI09_132540 [Parastagonospora nodorum]